ncbi:RimK family alpha-L-glutamate ligase [Streptomyces sp. NPDC056632]|uniref:ATP-grasp domain-containing protein n=1 Tax=Streptomyces sp. NPDC056632 TaxID=3345884 RepID=UPI0036A40E8D
MHFWLILTGVVVAIAVATRLWKAAQLGIAWASRTPVSARPSHVAASRSVLILYGGQFSGGALVSALRARGIRVVVRSVDELCVDIHADRPRIRERLQHRDLADFGMVQLHGVGFVQPSLPAILAAYLSTHRRTLVNREGLAGAGGVAAPSKLHQYVQLALAGENVPDTSQLPPRGRAAGCFDELADRFGTPFVVKPLYPAAGELTELVHDEQDFTRAVERPGAHRMGFLAQRHVPNNGTFLLLVVDGDVPVVIHRCSTDGSHITNRRHASHATLFEPEAFEPQVKETAVRCAALFGYDVATVTVVQDRGNRSWSILGVNGHPPVGGGPFALETSRAVADYASRRLRRGASVVTGKG